MKFFFRPTSRILVSRPLAILMNTLNLLGPALLLCALFMLMAAHFGNQPTAVRHRLLIAAAILVAAALGIRIGWGMAVRIIAARHRRASLPPTAKPET